MTASVANQAAATGMAVGAVVLCFVQLVCLNGQADGVSQVKVLGPADEVQPSLESLLSLFLFAA